MKHRSIWEGEGFRKAFPSFMGKRKTQVLVIGGGMAGILCAHRLQQKGLEVMLLE